MCALSPPLDRVRYKGQMMNYRLIWIPALIVAIIDALIITLGRGW